MGAILNFLSKNLGNIVSGAASAASLGYQISKDKHLTGSEREANAFSASQAELSRNFEAQQAEIARDWQEQQYLQYNSPAAQMRQYQEAGINPAMMYGQGFTPAPASTGIPSSASASSVAPSGAGNMVQMLTGLADAISGIKLKNAQAANLSSQTEGQDISNQFAAAIKQMELAEGEQRIKNGIQQIKESESKISLNNSTIEVNGVQIDFLGSQIARNNSEVVLNCAREALANLDIQKAKNSLMYQNEYEQARINLMKAQTESEYQSALQSYTAAALNSLEHQKESGLLAAGYYDSLVKEVEAQAKLKQREFKWLPVNSVIGNVTKVGLAVVGGVAAFAGKAVGAAAAGAVGAAAGAGFQDGSIYSP